MSGANAVGRRLVRVGRSLGLAVVGLAALAAAAWWRWARAAEPPPGPSDAALAAADPEVAAAVRVARERVLREPRSVEAWGLLGSGAAGQRLRRRRRRLPGDGPRPSTPTSRAGPTCAPTAALPRPRRRLRGRRPCRRRVPAHGKDEAGAVLDPRRAVRRTGRPRAGRASCAGASWNGSRTTPARHLDLGLIALADNDAGAAIPHLLRAAESPATRQHRLHAAGGGVPASRRDDAGDGLRPAGAAGPARRGLDRPVCRAGCRNWRRGARCAAPRWNGWPGAGPLEGGGRVAPADDGRRPVRRSRVRRSRRPADPGRGLRRGGAGPAQGGGPGPGFRGPDVLPRGGALQAGGTVASGRRPGFGRREVRGGRRRRPAGRRRSSPTTRRPTASSASP